MEINAEPVKLGGQSETHTCSEFFYHDNLKLKTAHLSRLISTTEQMELKSAVFNYKPSFSRNMMEKYFPRKAAKMRFPATKNAIWRTNLQRKPHWIYFLTYQIDGAQNFLPNYFFILFTIMVWSDLFFVSTTLMKMGHKRLFFVCFSTVLRLNLEFVPNIRI